MKIFALTSLLLLTLVAYAEDPVTPEPPKETPVVVTPANEPMPEPEILGRRRQRPFGIIGGVDDPIRGAASLALAYQAMEFLRFQLHLADHKKLVVAGAARLFVPGWAASPTLGLGYHSGYSYTKIFVAPGFAPFTHDYILKASPYLTFGFDYLFENGFFMSLGANFSFRERSSSKSYLEIGYFL